MSSEQAETYQQADISEQVKKLNEEIVAAHNKYYETSKFGLWKPNESPNGNDMFHLYVDGEVTRQKGGWAYGERSIFTFRNSIRNMTELGFVFPINTKNVKETHVILTERECYYFRERMLDLLNGTGLYPKFTEPPYLC